tara:strand:+ start:221 stop:394 length:174 start_codon:yes stop_codon:yes gene_type:complete
MNDTFEYHFEQALVAMLKQSNIEISKANEKEVVKFLSERVYTKVNFHFGDIVDRLLS